MNISVNTLSAKSKPSILNQHFCKILKLTVLPLKLQAILVPLLLMGTSSVVKAEEFKPKQLIAQSCRNINIQARTFSKGSRGGTCGYELRFQSDGNLVLTNTKSAQVLWATGTEGRGEQLILQSDGNLVLYGGGRALWATNTSGNPGAFFAIQADGNLVIYRSDGRQALWASNTDGGQARSRNAAGEWGGQTTASQPRQNSSQPIAPLTSLSTIPSCLFGTACQGNGSQHTGVDYFMDAGSNVRSICDGVVDYSSTSSANLNTIWNSFVIVRHNNCGDYQTLYAYYGHLNSQVSAGQNVQKGQTIGNIQNQGGNSHLHFGLATVKFNNGWGYQNGNLNARGWIDPGDFVRKY